MFKNAALFAIVWLFSCGRGGAGEFFIRNGDRVVFLGDSVTEQGLLGATDRGGLYTVYVECYALTRFPKWELTFRNVGVGGDSAMLLSRQAQPVDGKALKKGDDAWLQQKIEETVGAGLARDVRPLRPTLVTVAFGMNDFGYRSFEERRFQRYIRAEAELVKELRASGSRVALFTTQPLERLLSTSDKAEEDKNAALRKYADGLKALAAEQGVPFVDRFDRYRDLIRQARAQEPPQHVGGGSDAVHPGPPGHAIMAWCILKDLGASSLVSRAEIDAIGRTAPVTDRCRITGIVMGNDGALQFEREDAALPMPMDPRAESALKLVPIVDDLNRYMLKVAGLKAARYEVSIDGEPAATVDAATLREGWNMATAKGPITAQALRVMELVMQKNAAFYHRWREVQLDPARQKELPACDLWLVELESQIHEARQPKPHRFILQPAKP